MPHKKYKLSPIECARWMHYPWENPRTGRTISSCGKTYQNIAESCCYKKPYYCLPKQYSMFSNYSCVPKYPCFTTDDAPQKYADFSNIMSWYDILDKGIRVFQLIRHNGPAELATIPLYDDQGAPLNVNEIMKLLRFLIIKGEITPNYANPGLRFFCNDVSYWNSDRRNKFNKLLSGLTALVYNR